MSLRFQVSDLIVHPGRARSEIATSPLEITLPDRSVHGDVVVHVNLRSVNDGVIAAGTAKTVADLSCIHCLNEWPATVEVGFEAIFRHHPFDDESPIESGGWIDLEPVIHDEVSLGLPPRPECRPGCRGLCPTCGVDLNVTDCGGHGEDSDSPFSPLRQLFEPGNPTA